MRRGRGLLWCTILLGLVLGPAHAASAAEIDDLRAAGCPAYRQTHQRGFITPEEIDAARNGDFSILGKPVHLEPPVDWGQDPYGSSLWRKRLHMWIWMDVLLYAYSTSGDVDALVQARELALDWVRSNPRPAEPNLPWGDKRTGDRAGYLAYLTRAAACEDRLTDGDAERLLSSARDHGTYLADPANYSPNNHGLFADAGLLLLTDYLPFLQRSAEWDALAWSRFKDTLDGQVDSKDAVHLEHSPGYHFLVTKLLETVLGFVDRSAGELRELLARMKKVEFWFSTPDTEAVRFGDTPEVHAPQVMPDGTFLRGLKVMRRAGYAIVRGPGRYLGVTAGYHSHTHKQADELSFDLYERGRHIVADTGAPGHAGDRRVGSAEREYVTSAKAHSTLIADGESFELGGDAIYGSGIRASGEGSGWSAVEGRNPLLERQGIFHRRLLLYRPGVALVIVDRVRSEERHTYRRYVQLGSDLAVEQSGRTIFLEDGPFHGSLRDQRTDAELDRKLVRGHDDPLLGWLSPGDWRPLAPRWAVVLRSRAADIDHAATLALSGTDPVESRLLQAGRTTRLRVTSPDAAPSELIVKRDGSRLAVTTTQPRP